MVFAASELAWEVSEAAVKEDSGFALIYKITFSGELRPGSAGRSDVDLMMAVTAAALVGPYPDVVLFDLTAVEYQWGNSLLDLFQVVGDRDHEVRIGCVVAAGPRAFPALSSLVRDGAGWLYPDLDTATERAIELARERYRAIG